MTNFKRKPTGFTGLQPKQLLTGASIVRVSYVAFEFEDFSGTISEYALVRTHFREGFYPHPYLLFEGL